MSVAGRGGCRARIRLPLMSVERRQCKMQVALDAANEQQAAVGIETECGGPRPKCQADDARGQRIFAGNRLFVTEQAAILRSSVELPVAGSRQAASRNCGGRSARKAFVLDQLQTREIRCRQAPARQPARR